MSTRPIWQVKREGKRIGSFYFTAPGGKRVNTHTNDATKALKFRERWLQKNAAPQKTDVQGAAAATIAALDATPDLDSPASEPPPPVDLPAAGAVALPALQADGYIPPPVDAGDWAADAARAAAGAGDSGGTGVDPPKLDPAFLEGVIEQAATWLVELQIMGQAWAITRGLKVKPGEIDGDSATRTAGKELWKEQLKQWMPTDIDAPPWLLALVFTGAATLPVQIMKAEPLPKEEKKPDGTQAAATSEAVGVAA